jgi:molecular chaperone GrpE
MDEESVNTNEDLEVEYEAENEVNNPKDKLKSLRVKLKTAEEVAKTNMDGWQRARADYANLQKQNSEQSSNLKSYIVGGVVEDLLPVLDSFAMAMSNTEVWESVDQNWRIGIEYILKQFNDTLEKHDVSEIKVQSGDIFKPELHQAMDSVETDDDDQDGKIHSVMQSGYKMGEDVLRPVKVKTFKYKK